MSCNNWEAGSLLLPSAAVTPLRTAVLTVANARRARLLIAAVALYEAITAARKAKRGVNQRDALSAFLREPNTLPAAYGTNAPAVKILGDIQYDEQWTLEQALFPMAALAVRRPLKKDFAPLKSSTTRFVCGEAAIRFDTEKRTVRYSSGENNRAVEAARQHPVVIAFFKALDRVVWTRATGGVFVGNDEYNRESEDSGGGGNYDTHSYGPLGGRKAGVSEEARRAASAPRYSSFGGSSAFGYAMPLGRGRSW